MGERIIGRITAGKPPSVGSGGKRREMPDYLSVLIGVDDTSTVMGGRETSAVAIDEYERTYDQLLQQAVVEKLAVKNHAPVVHFQKVFDDARKRAPAGCWIWDGIHPTYAGHQLMADE